MAISRIAEITGMVDSDYYESYGSKLQAQVVHVWYACEFMQLFFYQKEH